MQFEQIQHLLNAGKNADALKEIDALLETGTCGQGLYFLRAHTYRLLGNAPRCREALQMELLLFPENQSAQQLSQELFSTVLDERSFLDFEQSTGEQWCVVIQRVCELMEERKYREALEGIEALFQTGLRAEDLPSLQFLRGVCLMQEERYDEVACAMERELRVYRGHELSKRYLEAAKRRTPHVQ